MPLNSERVANTPLTGPELRQYVLKLVDEVMARDWVFNQGTSHPRVGIDFTLKFHFANPNLGKREFKVQPQAPLESAPLTYVEEGYEEGVVALRRETTVENPNLVRVINGMPIQTTVKIPPGPGELFPRIETKSVTYDPTEAPDVPEVADTDLSAETAKEWGVRSFVSTMIDTAKELMRDESSSRPQANRRNTNAQKVVHMPREAPLVDEFYGERVVREKTPPLSYDPNDPEDAAALGVDEE